MPTLTPEPKLPSLIKMILMGWSGTGKTSAYVPLAIPELVKGAPGHKLLILDYDGKAEEVIRFNLAARLDSVKARRLKLTPITREQHDAALANCEVEVLREKTKITTNGVEIIGAPSSWQKTMRVLERKSKELTSQHILIPDSLTYAAQISILAYTQALNGNAFGTKIGWHDYMEPQRLVKNFLTVLADMPCHVILCAHQEQQDIYQKTGEFKTKPDGSKEAIEEVVESVMVPTSIGSKGRITIPAQFNHLLVTAKDSSDERRIFTQPEDGVVTKTPFFAIADKSYPLNDGLVKYWMLGGKPDV